MRFEPVLLSALALTIVQSSPAAELAYDGSTGYTEGASIWGQAVGGSGFTGTWQSHGTEAGPATVSPGGLTYSNGGQNLLVSGDQQIDQYMVNGYTRAELATPVTSGTVYISALAMAPTSESGSLDWGPLITVNLENQNPQIDIPHDGVVHFVVFKIDLDTPEYTIWLDPTPGTPEANNADQIVPSYNAGHPLVTSLTHVVARGGWDITFDEFRVGDTFEDVTPSAGAQTGPTLAVESLGTDLVFTWNSQEGMLYNLRSDDDLQPETPDTWPILLPHENIEATPPENTLTIPRPAGARTFFVVEEFPIPPTPPLLSEDFENGLGSWTPGVTAAGTPATAWEQGPPTGAMGMGPATGANGSAKCCGTNLSGDYGADADVWLKSPVIAIPSGGAILTYQRFIDTDGVADVGSVSVLDADNGDTPIGVVEIGIGGVGTGWAEVSMALPVAANDNNIKLEFRFTSDNSGHWSGFYIDDVEVTTP